jgi:chemotaxis signal transduction protein
VSTRGPAPLDADDLRRLFDAAFASPPQPRAGDVEAFLAVRVGDLPFAFRVTELAGVAVARKIVPVVTQARAMLGLTGVRGDLVPVYGAAALLEVDDSVAPRWIALAAAGDALALAFAELEGYLEVRRGDVRAVAGSARARPHVFHAMESDRGSRGVISVASLLAAIREQLSNSQGKER